MGQKQINMTLITIINGNLDSEITDFLKAKELCINVFTTDKKIDDVKNCIYGAGYSINDVICTKLDSMYSEL